MVQTALKENPFSGHVFVFRGRRGDLIKMTVVGWRWAVPVCEEIRARKIHLAASNEWHRFSDGRAVVDVTGRDRLASARAQLRSTAGCVNYRELICLGFCI
jgi:hypothetical protein